MGTVRFHKTIPLFGGLVKINLNKKSVSVSIGVPGFGVTITGDKVHYHFGAPGTGLSYNGAKKHSLTKAKEK